ncbi:hypothetical protein [Erythrobacter tepidarius]|uniref:hypothetical protein n=1 Tax=Erythrobacter tepidarius TaxID=60454 RepID=UPI001180570A|nr:hypothetical protein [Erythrobacter tepidarius]
MERATQIDPVDALERDEEQAIAAVVRARFSQGDYARALETMEAVNVRRRMMRQRQALRRSA